MDIKEKRKIAEERWRIYRREVRSLLSIIIFDGGKMNENFCFLQNIFNPLLLLVLSGTMTKESIALRSGSTSMQNWGNSN